MSALFNSSSGVESRLLWRCQPIGHAISDPGHPLRDGQPGLSTLVVAAPVLVLWLYGTLVLAERRSGYIIILVGSLLGLGVSVIHFRGPSGVLNAEHLKSSGAFFFIWTLLALGVNATYSAVLSVSGLIASARAPR